MIGPRVCFPFQGKKVHSSGTGVFPYLPSTHFGIWCFKSLNMRWSKDQMAVVDYLSGHGGSQLQAGWLPGLRSMFNQGADQASAEDGEKASRTSK